MISNELGKQLHDRATRGESLTAEERAQMEAWYSEQDRIEMNDLGVTPPAKDMALLQAQVDSMIAQLITLKAFKIAGIIKAAFKP
jgi:hypothetical protein